MSEETKDNELFDFDEPDDGGMIPVTHDQKIKAEKPSDDDAFFDDEDEEEESKEEKDEENTEIVAETGEFSLDLVEEAFSKGLTSKDLKELGSEENIIAVLEVLDRRNSAVGSSKQADDSDDDMFADLDDENSEVENPDLHALKKRIEQLETSLTEEKSAKASSTFDDLPEEYEDLFGTPDGQSRLQKHNRRKVVDEIDAIRAGYKAKSKSVPSTKRLVKRAIKSLFEDFDSKVERKKFSNSVKKRESQFLGRANARDTRSPMDGRQSAIANVKSYLNDLGISDLGTVENFE